MIGLEATKQRGPVVSSVPTLARYLDGWLADVVRPLSRRRSDQLRDLLSVVRHSRDWSKRLDKLSVRDVQVWLNRLREQCQCWHSGRTLSVVSRDAVRSIAVATKFQWISCASLLVELDVHPRVAMQILRHSRISITMDIYSQAAAASIREALRRLGTTLLIRS